MYSVPPTPHKHSDKAGFFSPSMPHLKYHFSLACTTTVFISQSTTSRASKSRYSSIRVSVCEHPLVRPDPDVWMCAPTHHMMIKIGLPSCQRPNFSCTHSPDTCTTPPFGSFPAYLASAAFATTCLPENVALFPSPEFGSETASVSVKGDCLVVSQRCLPQVSCLHLQHPFHPPFHPR